MLCFASQLFLQNKTAKSTCLAGLRSSQHSSSSVLRGCLARDSTVVGSWTPRTGSKSAWTCLQMRGPKEASKLYGDVQAGTPSKARKRERGERERESVCVCVCVSRGSSRPQPWRKKESVCTYVCMYVCMYVCIYIYIHILYVLYILVCVYVRTYVRTYVGR